MTWRHCSCKATWRLPRVSGRRSRSGEVDVRRRDDGGLTVGGVGEAGPAVALDAVDAEVVADEGEALLVHAQVAVEGDRRDASARPVQAAVRRPGMRDVDEAVAALALVARGRVER